MNIAFDADGVIFPIEDFQLKEGQKFFKDREVFNIDGYGIKDVFNCTNEEEVNFWIKNTFKYNREVIATNGIPALIQKLRSDGNKVYIITARAKASETSAAGSIMRTLFENSLKRNNIKVDGIIYGSTNNSELDKYNAIKKYNISIMVDDKKENIEKIKLITNAICFATRNNKNYFSDNIYKVENCYELEKVIYNIIHYFNISKTQPLNYKQLENKSDEELKIYFDNLRKSYYDMRTPFELEKGEKGCIKIIGKMQKVYNFLYRPHVLHHERFPKNGGAILAANHLHAFDPLLIMCKEKNIPFHLLAKSELLDNKIWNYLFTNIGSFFVDNTDANSRKKAKEEMIKTVLNGGYIMMFPEGTRNKTEKKLLDFHYGVVSIAQITGMPIYPFGINSDYKLFKNNLAVSIGEPIYVDYNDDLNQKNVELATTICNLLTEIEDYESVKRLKRIYKK